VPALDATKRGATKLLARRVAKGLYDVIARGQSMSNGNLQHSSQPNEPNRSRPQLRSKKMELRND